MKEEQMVSLGDAMRIEPTYMYFILALFSIVALLSFIATRGQANDNNGDTNEEKGSNEENESVISLISKELNIQKETIKSINFKDIYEIHVTTEQGTYLVIFKENFSKIKKIFKLQEVQNKDKEHDTL